MVEFRSYYSLYVRLPIVEDFVLLTTGIVLISDSSSSKLLPFCCCSTTSPDEISTIVVLLTCDYARLSCCSSLARAFLPRMVSMANFLRPVDWLYRSRCLYRSYPARILDDYGCLLPDDVAAVVRYFSKRGEPPPPLCSAACDAAARAFRLPTQSPGLL